MLYFPNTKMGSLLRISLLLVAISVENYGSDHTKTVSALVGQSFIIKCRNELRFGVLDVKLQWSKDLFGLENSTMIEIYKNRLFVPTSPLSGIFDLHFNNTEVDDQGLYGCHVDVTLLNGSMISTIDKFILNIIVPPRNLDIIPHSHKKQDYSLMWLRRQKIIWGLQNHNIILKCDDNNSSIPYAQIIWKQTMQFNNPQIMNMERDQSTIVQLTHKFDYSHISCHIQNKKDYLNADLPLVNYTIRILYLSKLRIINEDGKLNVNIREGEMSNYLCDADSPKEANLYYSWYIRYLNSMIPDHFLINGSTSNSLTLKMTQKHHRSRLHCILKGIVRERECSTQLNGDCELNLIKDIEISEPFNILYSPRITNPFENVTITDIGEWVTLNCNVDSNPTPTIKFYKTYIGTSKAFRSTNWYHQTKISNLIDSLRLENVVNTGSYHRFKIINDNDLDIYICEVKSTIFGSTYKYFVVSKVEDVSIIIDRPVIKVQDGGTAMLMCIIEGWPLPKQQQIKWHHSDSRAPLVFNERLYVVNRKQLLAIKSEFYLKNIMSSDYGSYNCSFSDGKQTISRQIDLQPLRDPFFMFTIIGIIGLISVTFTMTVIIYIIRQLYGSKQKKNKTNCNTNEYSGCVQTSIIPSSTIENSMENGIMLGGPYSLQGFQIDGHNCYGESMNMYSNLNAIQRNRHHISRLSSSDSRNGPYQTRNSIENNRYWDSKVYQDNAVYRNNQMMHNTRGFSCSTGLCPEIVSIGLQNLPNEETGSRRLSNIDHLSDVNGSIHSAFLPSSVDGSRPMIASTGNHSFVCIPVEEYQQHMRLLHESMIESSIHSLSDIPCTSNVESYAFKQNCKAFNNYEDTTANITS